MMESQLVSFFHIVKDEQTRKGPEAVSAPEEMGAAFYQIVNNFVNAKFIFVFFLLGILVEAASGFAPQPAGFHVFAQQRTGPVFGIAETVEQSLHDGQAGI